MGKYRCCDECGQRILEDHEHRNPSPSHAAAAWCNGTPEDPGCGGPVPIERFVDGPHQSYFIDGRYGPAQQWDQEHGWHDVRPITAWANEVAARDAEIEDLRAEIRDGRQWMEAFVRDSSDPGVGALAWLARNV